MKVLRSFSQATAHSTTSSQKRYLKGRWSDLQVAPFTRPTRDYICFDVFTKKRAKAVGQVDARQIFPRIFQVGAIMQGAYINSGLGLDASIALIAWLFDFREAHSIVVVTSTENKQLDSLFRLSILNRSATSTGYLTLDNQADKARWGVMERADFERKNTLLQKLREGYLYKGQDINCKKSIET